jgi:penicillin amidase
MKRSDIRYNRAVNPSDARSRFSALRAINLSIAVLLAAIIGTGYRFVWRALPETSGEMAAAISGKASIVRDSLGVPHISAATWQDAVFLQGYATAQDRMWQMDAMRRLASGELSEVVGEAAFNTDRDTRQLRLPEIAEAQEKKLTQEARDAFGAYARGVNFYLETHRDRLPIEFSLLRYQPRPWRIRDTVLIGLHMERMLTTSWQEELRKLHMLTKGDKEKVSFLYPARIGTEIIPGSNAWVVSGAHTVTGKPILANDPHLEQSLPSIWYMIHLKSGDLDVTGAALPGVPGVIIGHNRRIAWGMTNLEFDMQDLYRERIDLQTGRYAYREQTEPLSLQSTSIAVKGKNAVNAVNIITRHGSVLVNDQGQSYALQWLVPGAVGDMDFAFLAINRARNWEEFNTALKRHAGPPQNFVYADVDGNIGYHVAGQIPLRAPGCHSDVPQDGADGMCEWEGIIPYEDLPQAFNPPSGIIVTANQNPFPANYKYPVAGGFAPIYRAKQITSLLESKSKWSTDQMLEIQKDVYAPFFHLLATEAVKASNKKTPSDDQVKKAIGVLRDWNGQMEKGQAAPLVALLLYAELRKALAELAAPGVNEYTSRAASPVIERILLERPAGWFDDYDQWLLDSLKKAIAEGEKAQGSNVSRWDYGQYIELTVENPVLGKIPFIGKNFNVGPVPMSGSSFSVKQVAGKLSPSFRMIVDFANLDGSLANIPIGESGHFLSKHYKDQWNAYYNAHSFPMQFDKVTAESTLTVRPF